MLPVIQEFYAEQAQAAAERMDTEEGDPRRAYKGGRRSCVVSALVRVPLPVSS